MIAMQAGNFSAYILDVRMTDVKLFKLSDARITPVQMPAGKEGNASAYI